MPKLKIGPLDNLDGVDAAHQNLYTQDASDQKWYCTEVEYGWKQVKALKDENGARRISEKQAKDKLTEVEAKLAAWGEHTPEDTLPKLDRITELEESSKGKVPEAKLNELAEQRVKLATAAFDKKLKEAADALTEANKKIDGYVAANNKAKILKEIRENAGEAGFQDKTFEKEVSALNLLALTLFEVDSQGNVVAKEDSGFLKGSSVKDILPELLEQHAYLGKTSVGTGATGSGNGSGGGVPNVFTPGTPDLGARAKLRQSNPKEYERQLKVAGLTSENWHATIQPKA